MQASWLVNWDEPVCVPYWDKLQYKVRFSYRRPRDISDSLSPPTLIGATRNRRTSVAPLGADRPSTAVRPRKTRNCSESLTHWLCLITYETI